MEQDINPQNKNKHKLNEWKILSIILVVIAGILLLAIFKGGVSAKVISGDDAGKKLVDYLNTKTGGGVELVSSNDKGYLYEVKVKYQSQEILVFITKDGEYFLQGAVLLTKNPVMGNSIPNSNNANVPKDVEKSNKPVVEAFIFSYCPYGLQFEKALFPVYDLLKDKADFRIVAIGAMHGEYERIETLRQISIEQLYGKDKLFSYLKEFNINSDLGACRGEETCSSKYLPAIYKKLGIDKAKVDAYMKSNAEKIYNEQGARASQLGIGGSPTFVINNVQVQVNRSPDSIKSAVCNAFINKPSECDKSLSTQAVNPGFG